MRARRRPTAAVAAVVGALVVVSAACSSDDREAAAPDVIESDAIESGAADGETSEDAAATTTAPTTTTTTIAPEDIEPLDEELDIDREFVPEGEPETLGPIGTTETTIPTDEGEISIGGGEVPALAGDFPLPEGYEVQLASEIPGEFGVSGRVDGELAELVAFFESSLPAAGYEITDRQEVPGVLAVLSVEGPLGGDVVISQEPGGDGWTVVVALAESE